MTLEKIVDSSVEILRGLAAVAGVKTEQDARSVLRSFDPNMPYAVVAARSIARAAFKGKLTGRVLPPYTTGEIAVGRRVLKGVERNKRRG